MRPGRIFLFLLAVVLTLFILSLAVGNRKLWGDKSLDEVPSDTLLQQSLPADTVPVQAIRTDTAIAEKAVPDTALSQTVARDTLQARAIEDPVNRVKLANPVKRPLRDVFTTVDRPDSDACCVVRR